MNNTVAAILWMRLFANIIPAMILFYVIYFVPARMGKITTTNNINIGQSRSSSGEDTEATHLKDEFEKTERDKKDFENVSENLKRNLGNTINSSIDYYPER